MTGLRTRYPGSWYPTRLLAHSHRFWTFPVFDRGIGNWNDPGLLRRTESATTQLIPLGRGCSRIIITHSEILGVTPEMLDWWFTHFPYIAVRLRSGQNVSAYRFWHPADHRRVSVRRHSMSGQLGMARGALLEFDSLWGRYPRKSRLQIARMDQGGLSANFVVGTRVIAAMEEIFERTRQGTLCTTVMTLEPVTGNIFRPCRSRRFDSEVLDAWIKHKIEEVGNLERVVPLFYRSWNKARNAPASHPL